METSENSWRNLAIALGVGAFASLGTGALASVALETMLGGSSLDGVYQRLEARGTAVASSNAKTVRVAYRAPSLSTSSLPEPGAWALMVMGVGAVGARLRNRRTHSHG
ncbi:MAG TPA: PEP-CTERM sorting domain-containing protein [Caulobacteraceae bacterium]|jgi:hypothetical protein